jgi:P27 family predicted phage terminase small subunit
MNEAADIVSAKGLEVEIEKVTPKGESYTVTETNPMIAVADKAFKNYIAMCKEFGLTPASRTKISAPSQTDKDEFAEFDN